mgnify:FL=1
MQQREVTHNANHERLQRELQRLQEEARLQEEHERLQEQEELRRRAQQHEVEEEEQRRFLQQRQEKEKDRRRNLQQYREKDRRRSLETDMGIKQEEERQGSEDERQSRRSGSEDERQSRRLSGSGEERLQELINQAIAREREREATKNKWSQMRPDLRVKQYEEETEKKWEKERQDADEMIQRLETQLKSTELKTLTGPTEEPVRINEDLVRFVVAQNKDDSYYKAVEELKRGKKVGHWIWYVFPQLAALGRSENAIFYGITSLDEAIDYMKHPILRERYIECLQILMNLENQTIESIFGIDSVKVHSSLTLFRFADPENELIKDVLIKYFGILDNSTEQLLGLV